MNDLTPIYREFKRAHDAFIEVTCCDRTIGMVNSRPFTDEASKRFCEIQNRLGNEWVNDPEAQALLVDPSSHAAPLDGTPLHFVFCETCKATFMWCNGIPTKVQRT